MALWSTVNTTDSTAPAPLPVRPLPGPPSSSLRRARLRTPVGVPQESGPWPQLWLVSADEATAASYAPLLSAAERERAEGFLRPADRALYVTSHGALRQLLGAYVDEDPAALEFVREPCPGCGGPHGRPALPGEPGPPIHFSLSHTGSLALLGFADRPVGVDIEQLPKDSVVDEVAAALHPREREELAALVPVARSAAFARCWTRKEAYFKGRGDGIASEEFTTSVVGTGASPQQLPGWTLADIPAPPGFAAACALRDA
ncbi:4'-phosphopantetheinyl transferase family protein [Streptomyces apocyni]|uniref:4'-phosphopantetheinyl transferase family protein n=1 Tax=Streptomyces apocyni TaxID=2654677 RepID=UPI0012EA4604|nr:4'-phosphopantetheinyl transferase superfamily protein [Streptomyces apocyni]